MIDFHTHSLFSDGELLPSELVRRAYCAGYRALAITDHVDDSNIDFVVPRIVTAVNALAGHTKTVVIPGAEITHAPPGAVKALVARARKLGARLVVVHGETVVEPVAAGTNRAAIDAGADILSHPGLITRQDAARAAATGVFLEITSRRGHCLSNGHVAGIALETGASLVINTDAHAPNDLISDDFAKTVLRSAGLKEDEVKRVLKNSKTLLERVAG